jgi:hypothetical protein
VSDADAKIARMTTGATLTRAKFFESVQGFAGAGGTDTARMTGTSGNDTLVASTTVVSLSSGGMVAAAVRFDSTVAIAVNGGTDTAEFNDSAGSERFTASPTESSMTGTGFSIAAKAFDSVQAYARNGGNDTAVLQGSNGNDTFVGTADYGKLFGAGFFSRAKFFDSVVVHGLGGVDTATMVDSAGNDQYLGNKQVRLVNPGGANEIVDLSSSKIALRQGNDELYARGNVAQIRSATHVTQVYDFETVNAKSLNGGVDTERLEDVDFILQKTGPWINPATG